MVPGHCAPGVSGVDLPAQFAQPGRVPRTSDARVLRPALAVWCTMSLLLPGCGTSPGSADGASADAPPAVGALRLGEGERGFRAIEDGDTLLVAQGCQGSQHVWMTLQSEGLDPRGVIVQLSLTRHSDGALVTADFDIRLSLVPAPSGTFAQLTGVTLQIPVPDEAIGQDLVLRGRLEDRAGVTATAERRVRVAWGTEICAI